MAMLAEPRKKQRIGPNPRGKFFTDDQDNVGRQMLMKMGWKNGNGLGASSQGMSEPIKPKIHTDARGLGFDKTKDPWVAHNEEFEELLKNLNANSSSDNEEKKDKPDAEESDEDVKSNGGLETKSKSSRARIHYHKFVKNKDLSRASTKDISCIFGRAVNEKDNSYSLIGYPEEHSNASLEVDDNAVKSESKYEPTEETGSNFESVDESSNAKRKKKKKKRNKEKENDEIEASEITEIQHEEIQVEEDTPTEKTKKKKKKKKHRNEQIENDVEAERNEEADVNVTQTTQLKDDVPSEQDSVKKRKKSKRKHVSDEEQADNIEAAEVAEPIFEPTEEEQRPKKKKKRKKSKEDSNDELLPMEDEPEVAKEATAAAEPKQEEPVKTDNIESFGSLQFINRGSIEDYFRNKRLEMLNRLKAKGNTNE
ncbi:unnamed protein product [Orchesella dallaii]|uniref:G-patch domain-containing protein n=1 Tax=Orchesella dallaii TaxID=48710 RepID=A0ABP1Q5M3_9HEXA